jgi:tetratricopeptide (TPR) repeat protein
MVANTVAITLARRISAMTGPGANGKAAIVALSLSCLCSQNMRPANALPVVYTDPFYARGVQYFEAKDYPRAAHCFELAMQRNPANSDALFYDALTYQHTIAVFPKTFAAYRAYQNLQAIKKQAASKTAGVPELEPPKAVTAAERIEASKARVDEMVNKGNELLENGRAHEAERCFFEAVREGDNLGQNSMKLAEALKALANYYIDIGEIGKACEIYRRELRIREVCLGKNNFEVATCMTRQVGAYTKDGELDTAETMLRRCVEIYQKDYDEAEHNHKRITVQRANLCGALGSLAAILRVQNRANEAKEFEAQVKELAQQ